MAYRILKVPKDQEEMADLGLQIVLAAERMGAKLNTQAFLNAWLTNTKVLAEVADDNVADIKALAFLVTGRRWYEHFDTATLILQVGENPDQMMEYVKAVASASGAHSLIYDTGERYSVDSTTDVLYIHEMKL